MIPHPKTIAKIIEGLEKKQNMTNPKTCLGNHTMLVKSEQCYVCEQHHECVQRVYCQDTPSETEKKEAQP